MCIIYLRNWQVTLLLYTLGVLFSEYTAKASIEPRDYRVVFLTQQKRDKANKPRPSLNYKIKNLILFLS